MRVDKKIGVAVVGLGVGEHHARAYLATGCCDVRWLYDLEPSKAESLAATLGTGRVAWRYADILEDSEVHLVSIASFDHAHFRGDNFRRFRGLQLTQDRRRLPRICQTCRCESSLTDKKYPVPLPIAKYLRRYLLYNLYSVELSKKAS